MPVDSREPFPDTFKGAQDYINRRYESEGNSSVSSLDYPQGRKDIAVFKRSTSRQAVGYQAVGFDIIFVLWKTADGKVHYRELIATERCSDHPLNIRDVRIEDECLVVKVRKDISGEWLPWEATFAIRLEDIEETYDEVELQQRLRQLSQWAGQCNPVGTDSL